MVVVTEYEPFRHSWFLLVGSLSKKISLISGSGHALTLSRARTLSSPLCQNLDKTQRSVLI